MSLTETASTLARGVASQPVLAAFLLLNIVFMGALYFSSVGEREREHKALVLILERCLGTK